MNVVLLRIGIDTGSGGIHGPLFADGTFEYIPIPDGQDVDERTYGNTIERHGRRLIEYFPPSMRERMAHQPMHVDPEFESFGKQVMAGMDRELAADRIQAQLGLSDSESAAFGQSARLRSALP